MTSELHDSYFRLMTIKHSISKIEWASNDYISCQLSCSQLELRCSREHHTRPKGLGALMSWVPEKMLIRCSKDSPHPAEWALGLRLSGPGERERHNVDGHKSGGQNISVMFGLQLPLTYKTLSNPFPTLTNKVRGKYIFLKKSSCVFIIFVYSCVCCSLRGYVFCMNMYMRMQHIDQHILNKSKTR